MSTPLMDTVGVYYLDRGYVGIVHSFGRKWMHAVALGSPTHCVEIERDAQLRPVLLDGLPYPVRKAAKAALRSVHPITDGAREVLRSLKNGGTT